MKIQFNADKVKISGPKIDNSYTVTFEVGEYEYDKIKDLPKLNGEIIFVEVKNEIKGIIETS
ncbi:MAG: hypothetical protein FJ044_03205 [Candidatus Cloacimonetes bacterium]|nr:hypothetical protein [Candidatus Cloacimonadota bacterium]